MTGLTRRKFLKLATAGTCGAAIHGVFNPFQNMLAYAQPFAGSTPVLILVNLAGGCSYNICPPYNGVYFDKNPTVAFKPEDSFALSPEQGLHPSLKGIKQIYDEGKLGLINLVGYPDPNRSHDESTQIWFRGVRQSSGGIGGWGARLTCQAQGLYAGISLGGTNLLIQGDCNPPRAFGDLNNFGEKGFWGGNDGTTWLRITREAVIANSSGIPHDSYSFTKNSMERLQLSLDTIKRETSSELPVQFPNTGFGSACRDAAKLIAARSLGVRLIYLEHGGFDTHSEERPRLTELLTELDNGLTALVQAVKAMGRWDEVIISTMSEFGRTIENGSQGTDHGHASALLLMGGRVSGGIKSPPPSGVETSKGAFFQDYHVDFREVFRECVKVMGFHADTIFPEPIRYQNLNLFI